MKRFPALLLLIVLTCISLCLAGRRAEPQPQPAAPAAPSASQPASRPAGSKAKASERLRRARRIAALHRRALKLFKAGKYDKCKALLEKILEIDPNNALACYNLACVHARTNSPAEAMRSLNLAVEKGYTAFRHMERDPDLASIRKLKAYKELLVRRDEIQRARAEKILASLRKQFGTGYICLIDHDNKLVFATNVDSRTLEELKGSLSRYAEAQWQALFTGRFEQYVTVVLPGNAPPPDKRKRRRIGGYYNHARRMLVASTIGRTLRHEFTHALHFADQDALGQRHPIWVAEGLATLFESSRLIRGRAIPQPSHRLNAIQRLVKRNRHIPWKKLFKLTHPAFMKKAAVAYPQCRYVMMYMHEKGLLKKWYDTYTETYEQDRTGAKAMEKVFGKSISQIEKDWVVWIKSQRALPRRLAPTQAYIGVQVSAQADGLRVRRVVRGSAANKAGLKPRDVIVKIDGRRIVEPGALIALVSSHKVGDKLRIEFRRDGKYKTVTAVLGPMPGRKTPISKPKRKTPAHKPRRKTPRKKPQPATPNPPTTRPAKKAA